jgi:protoporphyrinogen oxidase
MQIAVIGAGACGLACAQELERLGHRDWAVYEQDSVAGGHAASLVDDCGFTWDMGGHVVFSRFGEFDALLAEVMKGDVLEHERSSYIRFGEKWVPYPFQNNLHHLAPEVAHECVLGLLEASGDKGVNFAEWMHGVFGHGITRHFLRPYNTKVWAIEPENMSASWIAERVSVPNLRRIMRSIVLHEDDPGWGPNSRFLFPERGGTGEIYRRLAAKLGHRVLFNTGVTGVDARRRTLSFDGREQGYDALVSTIPIDQLVARIRDCPAEVRAAAESLQHNGVYVIGVGYEAPLRDDKSWMYFPDSGVPFYRATNFAKYSPNNVPGGDTSRYSSYMTETSFSRYQPEDPSRLEERVIEGLQISGVVRKKTPIASVSVTKLEYAYPIPTVNRDEALNVIQPWLMDREIYSRGRFGSWRYEIGNMDHAVKMGIDAARLLVEGREEDLWRM